jgi:group II intron reverse transcriptase/maturase
MKLIHHILASDNLRAAWEEVAANKGAAGIDGVSIARWQRHWEERCANLAAAVRANTYRPGRLRRFTIPKRDGSPRQITILTVDDRVLQRAVLRVVDDYFDRTFLDCSYGYRQNRGVRNAIPAILHHRQEGRTWVLDADIDECFPSLDHALILEYFRAVVDDAVVLNLLRMWLKNGVPRPDRTVGIPLGAVISPLLCNIVLHRLDMGLLERGLHPVRYADDFCVFCATEEEAHAAWRETETILAGLKLRLEPQKTNITHFDRGFDFLGVHFFRDTYSFVCRGKRIEIEGEFDSDLFYDYVPDGYE